MSLDQIYLKTLELEQVVQKCDSFTLIQYLDWLEDRSRRYGALSEQGLNEQDRLVLYTRIANCILQWVVSSGERPSRAVVESFAPRKTIIWSVFQASVYGGQRILLERAVRYSFTQSKGDSQQHLEIAGSTIEPDTLLRLMSVISINDASEALVRQGLLEEPGIAFALWLGWTSERIRVTERALQAESQLLEFTINRKLEFIPRTLLECATAAYMYFTYMVHEQKHEMKDYLNRCFAKTLDESGLVVPALPSSRPARTKPKMIIPLERFVSGHAMHRCYAEYIAWLREEFETIALVNVKDIDEKSASIFDRIILKEANWTMQDIVNVVSMESPDIVYFPSIGMNTWVIMMSNIRLAPVQVMTCGHPATSTSKEIDFVYRPYSALITDAQPYFKEAILTGDNVESNEPWCPYICNTYIQDRIGDESCGIHEGRERKIAGINCKIMKLNAEFLSILKSIGESCSDIEWRFYPAEKGFGFDAITQFLSREFGPVSVVGYQPYIDFMRDLSTIDISLVPFPFGNTNSTIDALYVKKPVVSMLSNDPAMAGDILIFERLGLQSFMLASDAGQYVKLASGYLSSDESGDIAATLDKLSKLNWESILTDSSYAVEREAKGFVKSLARVATQL